MSERKWTPGEWECSVSDKKDWGAFVFGPTTTEIGGFAVADAHLIAAAPDLYDALQAMVDYCNAECGSKIYPGHQANQVLAKARGETQ